MTRQSDGPASQFKRRGRISSSQMDELHRSEASVVEEREND